MGKNRIIGAIPRVMLILLILSVGTALPVHGAGDKKESSVPKTFNHNKTVFPLTGQHKTVPCESCHLGGQYENLSRDCGSCHQLPRDHVVNKTAAARMGGCTTCHATSGWKFVTFVHPPDITVNQCQKCHDGRKAPGKPSNHIATTASCDTCHKTTAWSPAIFKHDAVTTTGKCATCHTKPAGHLSTTAQCDTCHMTTGWNPANFKHDAISVGKCSTCHTKPSGHLSTTAQCDTCHKTTGWTPATFVHDATTVGKCSTCHTKPSGHLSTTAQCDTCHKTTGWTPATFVHDATTVGKCSTCHTKPSGHIATTSECDFCHKTTGWIPVSMTSHDNPKLIGGHTGLECKTCHTTSFSSVYYRDGIQYGFCSNCHRRDYKYPGPSEHKNAGTTFDTSLQKNANCANCHEHASYQF